MDVWLVLTLTLCPLLWERKISVTEHVYALYKDMDETGFFLISFPSLKKGKRAQDMFYSFPPWNHKMFEQQEVLELIKCKGLNENIFLECQLTRVLFPLCTETFDGKGLELSAHLWSWFCSAQTMAGIVGHLGSHGTGGKQTAGRRGGGRTDGQAIQGCVVFN